LLLDWLVVDLASFLAVVAVFFSTGCFIERLDALIVSVLFFAGAFDAEALVAEAFVVEAFDAEDLEAVALEAVAFVSFDLSISVIFKLFIEINCFGLTALLNNKFTNGLF